MQGRERERPEAAVAARSRASRHLPLLVWVVLASMVVSGCADDDDGIRDGQGLVTAPGTWSVFDLRDGDCLDPDPKTSGEVSDVAVVPCEQPHLQEVFATLEHEEGPYPGAGAVSLWADGACLAELEAAHGLTLDDGLFVSYLLPTFVGWNKDDDRRVVCVLVFPDRETATGSVVAGTADIEPTTPVIPDTAAAADDGAAGGDA